MVVLAKPDWEWDAVALWEGVAGATGTGPKVAARRADPAEQRDLRTVECHVTHGRFRTKAAIAWAATAWPAAVQC